MIMLAPLKLIQEALTYSAFLVIWSPVNLKALIFLDICGSLEIDFSGTTMENNLRM